MLSMSLIFFMSKLFQHSLWYCCSLFWLSKYSLGNFSHWNVFDSVMEHFRISLYEWWNIFDRKKWCRKFSIADCRTFSIADESICRKFSVENCMFSHFVHITTAFSSSMEILVYCALRKILASPFSNWPL